MLRIIKWAYNLGQQTERKRVASILNDHRNYRRSENYLARELFGKDASDLGKKQQEKLALTKAVDARIDDIIDNITRPTQFDESRYSLLFPKEDK